MSVKEKPKRTIWPHPENKEVIQIIDQTKLPGELVIQDLRDAPEAGKAIREMQVRGAGLIGVTAAYGMYLATLTAPKDCIEDFLSSMYTSGERLKATRPTAVNLQWAIDRQLEVIKKYTSIEEVIRATLEEANKMADEDAEMCESLGTHGLPIIQKIYHEKQKKQIKNLINLEERKRNPEGKLMEDDTVYVMTHCNAGELAFIEWGSATAPIYKADALGIPVHVLVSETRPRLQGANLTAWELNHYGVSHEIITDNEAAHRMQRRHVDLIITGTDRTTYTGDVANKIGTLQKAICADYFGIPFYVALPSSTFDWEIKDGLKEIPIEQRSDDEVKYINGELIAPEDSPASNYAFDVTPRHLITGLITERGICKPNEQAILELFPEHKQ